MVITRKIEISLVKDGLTDEERNEQWQTLFKINDNLYKAANRLVNQLYLADEIDSILRLSNLEYIDIRKKLAKKGIADDEKASLENSMKDVLQKINERRAEILQRSQQSLAYSIVTDGDVSFFPTKILDTLKQNVLSHYKADTKDVARGEKSLSNYRKGMPIPFAWGAGGRAPILKAADGEFYLRWYKNISFRLDFGRDRSNNKLIVERCLGMAEDGVKYKVCNSSIQIRRKDNHLKMFMLLCIDVPNENNEKIKDMVVGIDLGLNVPIYAATNKTLEHKAIGSREVFLNQRGMFQRRFKALQRLQMTKGGKGRKHKLEPLERLREAERNWVRTQNHLFSKEVVEFAKQVKASVIQMEHLKYFGHDRDGEVSDDKKYVLRNWSYFELQNLISYKAEKAGIKVRFINPAYTSKTCSECGQIGVRQSIHFMCTNPECKMYSKDVHADYNGARNIALSKDIVKE